MDTKNIIIICLVVVVVVMALAVGFLIGQQGTKMLQTIQMLRMPIIL